MWHLSTVSLSTTSVCSFFIDKRLILRCWVHQQYHLFPKDKMRETKEKQEKIPDPHTPLQDSLTNHQSSFYRFVFPQGSLNYPSLSFPGFWYPLMSSTEPGNSPDSGPACLLGSPSLCSFCLLLFLFFTLIVLGALFWDGLFHQVLCMQGRLSSVGCLPATSNGAALTSWIQQLCDWL